MLRFKDGSEKCEMCGAADAQRYSVLVHFFIRLCAPCARKHKVK
jgi:hypothetical protein